MRMLSPVLQAFSIHRPMERSDLTNPRFLTVNCGFFGTLNISAQYPKSFLLATASSPTPTYTSPKNDYDIRHNHQHTRYKSQTESNKPLLTSPIACTRVLYGCSNTYEIAAYPRSYDGCIMAHLMKVEGSRRTILKSGWYEGTFCPAVYTFYLELMEDVAKVNGKWESKASLSPAKHWK
jgi:hypothetical protein